MTQKERIMRNLQVSAQEADEILAYDKAIDQGKRVEYDLPPELEKVAKKMVNVREHKKPTVYNFGKRTRAENVTKATIIEQLAQFLQAQGYDSAQVTNKERQITFTIGEDNFELTLVQKRKPKA